jgi:hypothetical protein
MAVFKMSVWVNHAKYDRKLSKGSESVPLYVVGLPPSAMPAELQEKNQSIEYIMAHQMAALRLMIHAWMLKEWRKMKEGLEWRVMMMMMIFIIESNWQIDNHRYWRVLIVRQWSSAWW